MTRKDKSSDAIRLAENLLQDLNVIDMQIRLILDWNRFEKASPSHIQRALEYVLFSLARTLAIEDGAISLLLLEAGSFRVLATYGVAPSTIPILESHLSYKPTIRGLAGLAAANHRPVYVLDVADAEFPMAGNWRPLSHHGNDTKAAICIPIGASPSQYSPGSVDPIAILSISLPRTISGKLFSQFQGLLEQYRSKIEILLVLQGMIEQVSVSDFERNLYENSEPDYAFIASATPPNLREMAEELANISPVSSEREDPSIALQRKIDAGEFDVFIAYNSRDRQFVEGLVRRLKERGLNPWVDTEQVPPGQRFQEVIEQSIPQVASAAILIGPHGLGRWQALELHSFITRCTYEHIPVIPVILPGVDSLPKEAVFLREYSWVDFSDADDNGALDSLEWGITLVHPRRRVSARA